jgi:sensor histidine kinase YesM
MESDTSRAKAMLESLVDYLQSSLGGLRQEQRTRGDEFDLVEAYLRIVAIRMNDRLSYHVDLPADLRRLSLPALTLQPLVENAIVHGFEPKIDGGRVDIQALRAGQHLELMVQDNGLGLPALVRQPAGGNGTALANIRERLRQRFGPDTELRIEGAAPHGVRARLRLPAEFAAR